MFLEAPAIPLPTKSEPSDALEAGAIWGMTSADRCAVGVCVFAEGGTNSAYRFCRCVKLSDRAIWAEHSEAIYPRLYATNVVRIVGEGVPPYKLL